MNTTNFQKMTFTHKRVMWIFRNRIFLVYNSKMADSIFMYLGGFACQYTLLQSSKFQTIPITHKRVMSFFNKNFKYG